MSEPTLRINEIFHSIQGESSRAGLPCVFVRLTGCHLRCVYCDTEYAFKEGDTMAIDAIVDTVAAYGTRLVEITGGEPLLQSRVHDLMTRLADAGHTVLLETSGACDIATCDPRVIRILDLKTPGSGEIDRNLMTNLDVLTMQDEVKFVITSREDYAWARDVIRQHDLANRCGHVLLSPVVAQPAGLEIAGHDGLDPEVLAAWILEDGLAVRMQMQMHKQIWHPLTRGV